ncbi:hypothetical protein O6H91_Y386700 [Diphasiastrum complanatum]|nr:hypothetical protein O6H91_Y386700 [Diphasiastrum complanatum]
MLDNSWCSSILESTSKGWIDGFSCNLKPFERISHQRLRSSCTTKDSRLRRSDWKPEEKLAAVFRPRLASVCGCAQRDRRWKETEFTEALVKRKKTRRNREITAPNGGKRFMDEMRYANNESPTVSKVRNSVPVVKCSFDPYEELRVSMVEMIVKKELHETQDLDELLRCYLSLNPPSYHDLIVRTFKDVWQEILGHP